MEEDWGRHGRHDGTRFIQDRVFYFFSSLALWETLKTISLKHRRIHCEVSFLCIFMFFSSTMNRHCNQCNLEVPANTVLKNRVCYVKANGDPIMHHLVDNEPPPAGILTSCSFFGFFFVSLLPSLSTLVVVDLGHSHANQSGILLVFSFVVVLDLIGEDRIFAWKFDLGNGYMADLPFLFLYSTNSVVFNYLLRTWWPEEERSIANLIHLLCPLPNQ